MATQLEKVQVFQRVLIQNLDNALNALRARLEVTSVRLTDSDSTPDEQTAQGTRSWNKVLPLLRDVNQAARAFPSAAEFPTWEPTAEQLGRLAAGP